MATIITNFYTVDNQIGANLNAPQTISVTTNPEYPAPNDSLGDTCQGIGGSQWVFVKASTTVTALNVVMIDESFNANNANYTEATTIASMNQRTLGIAEFQTSLANPGDYFWAQIRGQGGSLVNVQSTAAAGLQLYLSASTPGALTTTLVSSATNVLVNNAYIVAPLVSATAAVEVIFAFMRSVTQ
jgi:hypothetical protein